VIRRLAHLLKYAAVVLPLPMAAQGLSSDTAARVDAVFARFGADGPGCAVNVLRAGASVYAKGYGLASLELGVPISPKTIFDLGSTSKQFTAMSVLLLAHDGKLSLDDDIRKYVPELPDVGARVTLRQLLNHTSGWRDYTELMSLGGWEERDHTTDREALDALVRQRALNFPPGTNWRYSNTGYFLMSLVVQRVSGQSLAEFARQRIFVPLGMTHTIYLTDTRTVIPSKATGYDPEPGGGYQVDMSDWEQIGDGGVQSSVEDLARWDANFTSGVVGGRALLDEIQTPAKLANGTALQYAMGLSVDTYRGVQRVSHGGAWAGYRAMTMRFPTKSLSVLLTCNRGDANTSLLASNVANVFLPAEASTSLAGAGSGAAAGRGSAAALGEAGKFAGTYLSDEGGLVVYSARGDTLFTGRFPRAVALEALGPGRFRNANNGNEQHFSVEGGVRRLTIVPPAPGALPTALRGVEPVGDTSSAKLAEFAGRYTSPEIGRDFELLVHEGRLMVHPERGEDEPLTPVFRDGFAGPGVIQFERDASGRVKSFTFASRGIQGLRMTRR
jgi:CubicO group peptidase (beta-lactamase class C family)